MKKFECTSCTYRKCISILEDTLCSPPQDCVNKYVPFIPHWHEVTEKPTNCSQLPDWCKVGEWVYNVEKKQYQTISLINGTVTCKNIDSEGCTQYGYGAFMGDCIEARKRPFNAAEMKALVGKVIETVDKDALLVTAYSSGCDVVIFDSISHDAANLMHYPYTVDGKPCFKLEHLNDIGEWVE